MQKIRGVFPLVPHSAQVFPRSEAPLRVSPSASLTDRYRRADPIALRCALCRTDGRPSIALTAGYATEAANPISNSGVA